MLNTPYVSFVIICVRSPSLYAACEPIFRHVSPLSISFLYENWSLATESPTIQPTPKWQQETQEEEKLETLKYLCAGASFDIVLLVYRLHFQTSGEQKKKRDTAWLRVSMCANKQEEFIWDFHCGWADY